MLRHVLALNAFLLAYLGATPAWAQPGQPAPEPNNPYTAPAPNRPAPAPYAEPAPPPAENEGPAVDTTAGARLSGIVPMNESYGGADILTGLTIFGLFEVGSRFAGTGEVGFVFNGESDADVMEPEVFGVNLDFGGRGFLNEHAMAGVFLGGGFGVRWLHVDNGVEKDKGGGVGAYATAGVVLFRGSPVRLIADVRYDADLFKLDELTGNERAHGFQLGIGLSFRGLAGKSLFPW